MSQYARKPLSLKHAYVAAFLVTSAVMAVAQAAPPAGGHDQGVQGGESQHHMGGHMGHRDPAKRQAMVAKRQDALKVKLKLVPEQEAAWVTFTANMTPPTDNAMAHPDRAEMEKLSTPERIDKMRAMRTERHATMTAHMDKRAEATKAFYATLNPEQKKVFDAESFKGVGRHHGQHQGQPHKG